jgi:hypothetical protein
MTNNPNLPDKKQKTAQRGRLMIGGRSLFQGFLYGVGHGANVLFGGFQLKIYAVTVVGIGQSGLEQLQRRLYGH